jgi:hypothetical protein
LTKVAHDEPAPDHSQALGNTRSCREQLGAHVLFDLAQISVCEEFVPLRAWLKKWEPRVSFQVSHQMGRKVAVGPLEQAFTVICGNLNDRRGAFGNRERLNRLLRLMQLDINKQSNEQRYAKIIRDELVEQGGYSSPRRVIHDPWKKPSLRL